MLLPTRKLSLVCAFVLTLLFSAGAQPVSEDLPTVTGCLALTNAKVVTAPGQAPMTADVIIRDGLITGMGSHLQIPADAYRIPADSFYVYPAFIDAFSSIGIKEPEEGGPSGTQGPINRGGQKPVIDAEGNPPLEDAGITPFRSVRLTFDPKEKSISEWRAHGFAVAHSVPKGKMIPGKGSLVILSGDNTDHMLWKEDVSMYGQWSGAGGGYPATVIGIMAKWRELYHNATQAMTQQAAYDHASMVTRPDFNQAHVALIPVVNQEMPLYFRAAKMRDISRALALQKDLGMKMVIADAEEAWYEKEMFAPGSQIGLILSTELPEDKGEKEKKTEAAAADSVKTDPEKAAFEQRRLESLNLHRQQAAILAKDGVVFSLGTMSCKAGDFLPNVRTMIEQGLTADQALAALTTTPAKLLQIDKYCGTVATGKMANLIVSTKPIFASEAAIRYMVVEGQLYDYPVKEKKKANPKSSDHAAPGALTGKWKYTIDAPDQKREGIFEFADSDGSITGTMTSEDITTGNNELEDIVMDGHHVSFIFDFDMGGQMVALEFDLNVDGESFDGTVTVGSFGSFPISGQRISKPD